MEHRADTAQRDAYPTSRSFADLGSEGPQQCLNLAPAKVGRRGLRKNPTESASVPAVHWIMISKMDINLYQVKRDRASMTGDPRAPVG